MRPNRKLWIPLVWTALAPAAFPQAGDFATVLSKPTSRIVELPGEFLPYLSVGVHARVPGYVERILVDRGSAVREGQLLAELSAPEMTARIAEVESKAQAAESQRAEAEARLAAAESLYERLKKASETPGAIAGNELVQIQKQIEADRASVMSHQQAKRAAEAVVNAEKLMQGYLKITAPFDGVVTERLVHPGALVGSGANPILLVIQQIARLRLVVSVPEAHAGAVAQGARVSFSVPAFPERAFSGVIARNAHSLDKTTRTMAVELDVSNPDGALAPGMYPTVQWPVRRAQQALMVPRTSVVTTTERTFVIRNQNGRAEWVDVRRGASDGDLVEVTGGVKAGDVVVRRATDEIRDGSPLAGVSK